MIGSAQFALAAEAFVGAPFQLHGRDPATGLDCVGLVAASLAAIGRPVSAPRGYRLRNSSIAGWLELAAQCGFRPAEGKIERGDLLMTVPGPAQHHLMIARNANSVVHAHAGLRRVVVQPVSAPLNLAAHWRLSISHEDT